jgi:hypothetical protein
MHTTSIRWLRAVLGALAAEIGQIAATVLWVAFYSYVVAPGQAVEAYHAHAQVAGPWVSIFAGAAIFYAASRWIAGNRPTAMALFAIFVVLDGALVLMAMSASDGLIFPYVLVAVSYLTKAWVCHLGGSHAEAAKAREARTPA